MTKDEALKLALEALEGLFGIPDYWTSERGGGVAVWRMGGSDAPRQAIAAIKEALAQPEQEPVAYGMWDSMLGYGGRMMMVRLDKGQDGCTVPLYTTPPQRQPLTNNVKDEFWIEAIKNGKNGQSMNWQKAADFYAAAIEAAHGIKEKNT